MKLPVQLSLIKRLGNVHSEMPPALPAGPVRKSRHLGLVEKQDPILSFEELKNQYLSLLAVPGASSAVETVASHITDPLMSVQPDDATFEELMNYLRTFFHSSNWSRR